MFNAGEPANIQGSVPREQLIGIHPVTLMVCPFVPGYVRRYFRDLAGMIRALSIIGVGSSAAAYVWSSVVWGRCGYDCGIFGVATGPAAVAVSVGAAVLFVISLTALVVSYVRARTSRKANVTTR